MKTLYAFLQHMNKYCHLVSSNLGLLQKIWLALIWGQGYHNPAPVLIGLSISLVSIDIKGPLILLCQMILVECLTIFEFGATFSTVVSALNWFWFVFDLDSYIH